MNARYMAVLLLAISGYLNAYLLMSQADNRWATDESMDVETPIAVPEVEMKFKEGDDRQSAERIDERFAARVEELTSHGVSLAKIRLAVLPNINSAFIEPHWQSASHSDPMDWDQVRFQRRKLVEKLFQDDPRRADWDEDTNPDISLEFHLGSFDERAKTKHEFFKNICGAVLSETEKSALFSIFEQTKSDTASFEKAVRTSFPADTAESIILSQNGDFVKYYRYALDPALSKLDRRKVADVLRDMSKQRLDALDQWQKQSDNELRRAGTTAVEDQMLQHVERELGPAARAILEQNGW